MGGLGIPFILGLIMVSECGVIRLIRLIGPPHIPSHTTHNTRQRPAGQQGVTQSSWNCGGEPDDQGCCAVEIFLSLSLSLSYEKLIILCLIMQGRRLLLTKRMSSQFVYKLNIN